MAKWLVISYFLLGQQYLEAHTFSRKPPLQIAKMIAEEALKSFERLTGKRD